MHAIRHVRAVAAALAIAALAATAASTGARAAPQRFEIDPSHLSIGFLVHHLGYEKVLGMFLEGSGSFSYDPEDRRLSDLRVVIQADSVFTNDERRDEHLRGPDFLNAGEFPEIVFEGKEAEPTGENTGRVDGTLTILGVTRPASLDVTMNKLAPYPFGSPPPTVIGISARGHVMRSAFGMTYGVENGWVGDRIDLIIEFEAIRQE